MNEKPDFFLLHSTTPQLLRLHVLGHEANVALAMYQAPLHLVALKQQSIRGRGVLPSLHTHKDGFTMLPRFGNVNLPLRVKTLRRGGGGGGEQEEAEAVLDHTFDASHLCRRQAQTA